MTGDDAAPPNPTALVLAAALGQLNAGLAPIIESTAGYRQACEDAGFSPTVAEQMALRYFETLIAVVQTKMLQAS